MEKRSRSAGQARAKRASPQRRRQKKSEEKRRKSGSPWGKSHGAWSKEQPRTIGQKRKQIKICADEGKSAEYCFLGGITKGKDGRVTGAHYPRCTVGTCKINKRGESAAEGYAHRICKSPKSSAKSKATAKQVLRKLGKACK